MTTLPYEHEAKEFCEAIKLLAERQDSLENLEMYLSYHFETWLKCWACSPESISAELNHFAEITL